MLNQKIEELLQAAKLGDLINKKDYHEENKNKVIWILAIIGTVAAVAAIAYAVYKYLNPDYLEDFEDDFDDDFDDDFYDDEEEESFDELTEEPAAE